MAIRKPIYQYIEDGNSLVTFRTFVGVLLWYQWNKALWDTDLKLSKKKLYLK